MFGREPDYDTNLDPVVRTSAVEIRKRIAQYYDEPSRGGEIRIDFPPGSYLPEFRLPERPAIVDPTPTPAAVPPNRSFNWLMCTAVLAFLAALGVFAIRAVSQPRDIDAFWGPVLESTDPISIYIGGYNADKPLVPLTLRALHEAEQIAFSDATAMARMTSWLDNHGKAYRFRLQPSASIEDLKDGPAILIGAFNNSWALKLTDPLRFSFVRDSATDQSRIQDREHPDNRQWAHIMDSPLDGVKEDYAVISRLTDPSTGRVAITVSGLAKFGTEAAGEFLTSPAALSDGLKQAPAGWQRKNMQLVLATTPVGRRAGPAKVIASHYW